MKTVRKILIFCLFALTVMACSDDNRDGQTTRKPVVLSGEIFTVNSDVATIWSGGQTVGVYMLKSGTTEIVDHYANVKYLADNRGATGYLVPAGDQPMYLPDNGEKVDIRAYYPYDENAGIADTRAGSNHTTKVSIDEKTKPDAFLYSQNSKGLTNTNTRAILQIKSMLALVKIDFECSLADAKSMTAHIKNIATHATFDLMEGKFIDYQTEEDASLPMNGTKTENNTGITFNMQSVILPGQVANDVVLEVKVKDSKGEILKEYTPVPLQQVLEQDESSQVTENTQYNVTAQLTEEDEIETQLTGTTAICILNWTGNGDDAESGVAPPGKK